ncbi:universal stress protein [Herbaspirillum hiltneri N3]|uniref:Universal stress protein n=1 Tax=Herbaspirillum hiltneri N3 TaxID=1262470 RepID=A0ABM5V1R0_9BURK|nr:universal stress protein [Herbaspirillum hiltneri]AKZ63478.1 universal stress protein [Herbaspirillum hiltneri N3]
MSYKTILVYIDQSSHCAGRIKIAAEIAIAHDAHLVGVAVTGISRFIYPDGMVFVTSVIDGLRERAQRSLDRFEETVKRIGVNSYESRISEDDAQGALAQQARYSDLIVVSQIDLNERDGADISDLPEYVMLNSSRPVLTIPYAGTFENVGRNALIAWDGSMEATHAITNAMPMLKKAHNVTIALFNAARQFDVHGEQPGADIALYLARHGVKIDVVEERTEIDVGNALLSLAADKGADLLVMGGYGHSRFQEVLLGGVTSTILDTMTLPVLMSH